MITVFPLTRGPYITIADIAEPNYRNGPAIGDPKPIVTLDPVRAVDLVRRFPEITGDEAILSQSAALIDAVKLGYSAELPGVGHIAEIQHDGDGYQLVSDNIEVDIRVTPLEIAAIFRAMAAKYQWSGW